MGKTKSFNDLKLKSKDFTICVEFPILAKRKTIDILQFHHMKEIE